MVLDVADKKMNCVLHVILEILSFMLFSPSYYDSRTSVVMRKLNLLSVKKWERWNACVWKTVIIFFVDT